MVTELKIITDDLANSIWKTLYDKYKFRPGMDNLDEWIIISDTVKTYYKYTPWSENQEALINTFFEKLIDGDMYALDWQHDCFMFSPKEHIPFDYDYYDADRNFQVYFPTYYPNGDYYFFFDTEWKYGLFGHPWRHEIVVMGKELIELFENKKNELGID